MPNKVKTLILLPMLAVILTACTVADLPIIGKYFEGTPSGPVTLNVWGLWDDPEVMNSLVQKYQAENPNVTINYEDRTIMRRVDYKERVFERSRDESTEIDIMLVHNSWVPRLSPNLAPMQESLMSADAYKQAFYPVAFSSGVIGGKIYAVPAFYDGLALVYNKAHFEEIGQKFPPTVWEEFRRLALELTIRNDEAGGSLVRGGAAMGTANNIPHFSDVLGMMWAQADVSIPSEIDTKPAYDALNYYTNFATEDKVWDNSMPDAHGAFVSGQVSMIFIPSWELLPILNAMPNIEDIGVAAVPQARTEQPASWGTFWMYTVPVNSKNPKTAWDFINYVAQEEQQLMYYSVASTTRAFGSPYSLVSLSEEITNPLLRAYLDIAPFAKSGEIASKAGNSRQETALREAVNKVLSKRITPEDALKEAKTVISQ